MSYNTLKPALPAYLHFQGHCIFLFAALFAHTAFCDAPTARYGHTAIWTGSEMIVWGGTDFSGNGLGDGARYDPRSNIWTPISMNDAPAARYDHTAVWTGTEMIIWGGRSSAFNFLPTGARYNPATDRWVPLRETGAPSSRVIHSAVWIGSEMIIWGGLRNDFTYVNDGARYHPPSDSWTAVPTNGVTARGGHSAVWTGNKMVVWGGRNSPFSYVGDGAAFDPIANSWSPISTLNAPTARAHHATVWTGSEMFIWGGYDGASFPAEGRRYQPGSDSWSVVSTLAAPSPRYLASGVWTGSEVIIWGGSDGTNRNSGARYNFAANTWSPVTTNGAPAARSQHSAVWSGTEMVVWGGRTDFAIFDDMGRYNRMLNSWNVFPPAVTTLNATGITTAVATLLGTANPNNTNTTVWFEWGPTTNYGNLTPAQSVGNGTNQTNFSFVLGGLVGNAYYFRAVASNSLGVAYGSNLAFSTAFFEVAAGLPPIDHGSLAWGDYNNDGRQDILFTGLGTGGVLRNTGSGFANGPGVPAAGGNFRASSVAWGDYNNDGWLDAALAGTPDGDFRTAISQILQNTNGVFVDIQAGLQGVISCSVAWGDYDNDGRRDLSLIGYDRSFNPRTEILRNTQSSFYNINQGLPPMTDGALKWGDFDNDGRLDLLSATATAAVWRNTGLGFQNVLTLPNAADGSAAWGDFDNDGRLDFLVTGFNGSENISSVWRNTGSTFTNVPVPGLSGVSFGAVAWGDYDNDGRLDFLLTGSSAEGRITQIWRNTGNGFVLHPAGFTGVSVSSAGWGDYDNDGRLDILFTGTTDAGPATFLWRNNSPVTNTPPSAPTGLAATLSYPDVVLSWNAATDAQTPSAGLSYNVRAGTRPGSGNLISPQSATNGFRRLPEMGNSQMRLTHRLTGLTNGQVFYWSVQAVDTAFAGGPFAVESAVTVVPPLRISRLGSDVRLSWDPFPGWILQETTTLTPAAWTNAPTGSVNPITLPRVGPTKFFRLRLP